MAAMNKCRCGQWKRWDAYACDDCNGSNTRRSCRERTANLGASLYSAAVEELRVRAAVARIEGKAGC